MPPSCVVDVNFMSSPLPIHKGEMYITSPLEIDHPCSLEGVENGSRPSRISLPSVIYVDLSHPLVQPYSHPTCFQAKIIDRMFKPLRLPHHLHSYPPYSFEYLPQFSGEDHVTAKTHLGAFENFFD
jgi:hypothetical protein